MNKEKETLVDKAIDAQMRDRFKWQWDFHMQQMWMHAIWATVLLMFATLSSISIDVTMAKVAAGLFAFASFCSLLSSRYHEFMASHKKWASMDPNLPVRSKDLNKSYWWAKSLSLTWQTCSFLGLISYIISIFLK